MLKKTWEDEGKGAGGRFHSMLLCTLAPEKNKQTICVVKKGIWAESSRWVIVPCQQHLLHEAVEKESEQREGVSCLPWVERGLHPFPDFIPLYLGCLYSGMVPSS